MASYSPIKIRYNPITVYNGEEQAGFVGAQMATGCRGTLPNGIKVGAADNTNVYSVAKSGSDSNAGTVAAPFLTIGKIFNPAAAGFLIDQVDPTNATKNLTGTVPQPAWPCYPIPPTGDYMSGPFTASNYLSPPSALYTPMSGLSTFTIEGWVYFNVLNAVNPIFYNATASTATTVWVTSTGAITFRINGTDLISTAGQIAVGNWYYVGFSFNSGVAKTIYVGPTPEAAVAVPIASGSSTQTASTIAVTNMKIGADNSGTFLNGYLGRLFYSNVARTAFPTYLYSSGTTITSGVVAAYYFQTLPLMVNSPKLYVGIGDSGTYNEGLRYNFQYEAPATNSIGIYAKDGFTPTFATQKGAIDGTYGAGNPFRVGYFSGSYTTDVYVNGTTGNDSNSGTSISPYKTLTKAFSVLTSSASNRITIQDSNYYTEKIVISASSASIFINAAANQIPTFRNLNPGTSHFSFPTTVSLAFSGIVFDEQNSTGAICDGTTLGNVSFADCSLLYGTTISKNTAFISLTNCYINNFSNTVAFTPAMVITNNYFTGKTGTYFNNLSSVGATVAPSNQTISQNTFNNVSLGLPTGTTGFTSGDILISKNLFINSATTQTLAPLTITTYRFTFTLNQCVNSSLALLNSSITGMPIYMIYANVIQVPAGTVGINVTSNPASNVVPYKILCQNNVVYGGSTNYNITFGHVNGTPILSQIQNNTSLNASTAGFSMANSSSSFLVRGLLDSGSATAYAGGLSAPVLSESNATVLSSTSGNENVTLSANDPAIFGYSPTSDIGADWAAFTVQTNNFSFDGLTFSGLKNAEGGIQALSVVGLIVSYCTFTALGTFALKISDSCSINNNFFKSCNGHAVKNRRAFGNLSRNTMASCAGAAVVNCGSGITNTYMSAYGCQYGVYDTPGSTGNLSLCVICTSGAYDYSGSNIPTYSIIGTLDPDQATQTLGYGCRQLDPLFFNANSEDLTLQAIARKNYFDSPAVSYVHVPTYANVGEPMGMIGDVFDYPLGTDNGQTVAGLFSTADYLVAPDANSLFPFPVAGANGGTIEFISVPPVSPTADSTVLHASNDLGTKYLKIYFDTTGNLKCDFNDSSGAAISMSTPVLAGIFTSFAVTWSSSSRLVKVYSGYFPGGPLTQVGSLSLGFNIVGFSGWMTKMFLGLDLSGALPLRTGFLHQNISAVLFSSIDFSSFPSVVGANTLADWPLLGLNAGAYRWHYGTPATAWTTIDFADTGAGGAPFRNPDSLIRRELPIKLTEGDQESGAIYSVTSTFKKEYELSWESSQNDMPIEQLEALRSMFVCATNRIQVDFGNGYVDAYFARQQGFEYTDMINMYADASVPTPLKTLVIREA